jgi:hypothetical protein
MQVAWLVSHQIDEEFVDGRSIDELVVVQHQHELSLKCGDLVDESLMQNRYCRRLDRAQQGQRADARVRVNGLYGSNEVPQEDRQAVVAFIKRQPRAGNGDIR